MGNCLSNVCLPKAGKNELFRFLYVFIHFNDLRDETREEQCEYEVEEDAIEVQSDEEVDTECTEKETILID